MVLWLCLRLWLNRILDEQTSRGNRITPIRPLDKSALVIIIQTNYFHVYLSQEYLFNDAFEKEFVTALRSLVKPSRIK